MMVTSRREGKDRAPTYPNSPDEWRTAIAHGLGLAPTEAIAKFQAGIFPFEKLEAWLQQKFGASKGYSVDFVPALVRNLRGLVAWVYGDASEPYWPGRDRV